MSNEQTDAPAPDAEAVAAAQVVTPAAPAAEPPRKSFVVTATIVVGDVEIRPGLPVMMTEAFATAHAASIRPATAFDLSAGPEMRSVG